tara:strand:+ start:2720 stop:3190 length:471 start_codon:yes stop_codon:yes gene_type:complete
MKKSYLKQIIREELQKVIEEASERRCKQMLKAGEISPDQYEACIKHFEKDYEEVEDTGMRALEEKKRKKKFKAKVRNRGDATFPAESSKVKDDKDHFPVNSKAQAKNALARASQYKKAPSWYKGSLDSLVKAVQRKVKSKYPSIKTTKASSTPGKG